MHKFNDWSRLLDPPRAILVLAVIFAGCTESGIAPDQYEWLSVSEAILIVDSVQDRKLSNIRGQFEDRGQGVYVLYEADDENKTVDFNHFIFVSTANADTDQEFGSCDGDFVVVSGMLVGGRPPVIHATSIDEAEDVAAYKFGTCNP